jgi:hypothetical protein
MTDKELKTIFDEGEHSAIDGTELIYGVNAAGSSDLAMILSKAIAYLFTAAGDILYATGAKAAARLAKGTAGQILKMNSGATAPEWVSEITYFQMVVFPFLSSVVTGDGKFYFHIPAGLNGMNLVEVHAEVITAGTTGTTDIQIRNVTQAADMLSTKITIDSGETGSDTAATPPVIDTDNDDVAENDLIAVDIDAASTTNPKGLIVTAGFRVP